MEKGRVWGEEEGVRRVWRRGECEESVTEGDDVYITLHPPDLGYWSLIQTKRNISREVHQRLNISQPSLVTLQRRGINNEAVSVVYST